MNTPSDSDTVAQSVAALMAEKGVTQVALSESTFIPRATLIRRLHGQTPFTVTELVAIGAALGVPASTFMEEVS